MKISIALAQAEFILGAPESNYQKASWNIREAAASGADLVLLPELWASGYDLENCDKYGTDLKSGMFLQMQMAAKDHKIAVGCSLIEGDQGDYYNTFVFYDSSGTLLGSYRKIHLFEKLKEKDYFRPGTQIVSFMNKSAKIGLATCYDLRFPEIFRAYAAAGVELILITAEWPKKRIEHWSLLLQTRAIENQLFVAAVNKVGKSQGAALGGCSAIVSPMGDFLVQGTDLEALLSAEIDLKEVGKIRRWMPVLNDRKPELYQKFFDIQNSQD